MFVRRYLIIPLLAALLAVTVTAAPQQQGSPQLDAKVKAFLDSHQRRWRDMNISAADGQLLYDLIVKHGYTRALEIGTSTGHSAIWIAWALSKTGGRLITIDIDRSRHREALANFKEAGVDQIIDARLADAHELVPKLEGPFDFVFSDADKGWYTNYLKTLQPKLTPGGCFTAHNVRDLSNNYGIRAFVDYLKTQSDLETTFERGGGAGISVSFKKGNP